MSTVAQEASAILGVRIEPGYWKQAMDRLSRLGYPTRKQANDLLIMLCERMEQMESNYGATANAKPATQATVQSDK
jgi:hypothetical protein